jgi:hypothetical protein
MIFQNSTGKDVAMTALVVGVAAAGAQLSAPPVAE